jgi:hypothetical protein
MNIRIPLKLANGIYLGFTILLYGLTAFSRNDPIGFLGRWIGMLVVPACICAAIYGVTRLRKRPFYWQRWFFWIGLVIWTLASLPTNTK